MKVFWSWQSDTPATCNKNFVKEALELALEQVSEELGLTEAERPEVDHDTKGARGLVPIVDEIFRKIALADVFVGDVTFVGSTPKTASSDEVKLLPNPNVLIELGHALTSIGFEGIILVTNTAFGGEVENLPFDLRHRRGPIRYELKPDATPEKRQKVMGKLVSELVAALTLNLGGALEQRDATVSFDHQLSRPGDRSTWLKKGEKVRHSDPGWSHHEKEWLVPEMPRAYMRLIPTRWKKKLSRTQVSSAPDHLRLWAIGPWRHGDYGPNDRGVVSVGFIQGDSKEAVGVTQWFNRTGEIWGFTNAATFPDASGRLGISSTSIAKEWMEFLQRGLRFFEHFDATGPIHVEAGVTGLDNTFWINAPWGSTRALEKEVYLERSHHSWTADKRLAFLTDIYNQLLDAYSLPHVPPEQVPCGQ